MRLKDHLVTIVFGIICVVGIFPVPLMAAEYHVSVTGTSGGDGSSNSPWDLETALNHPSRVRPGDTIWVHAGTYTKSYTNNLNGTGSAPIIVRAYPGERAILDYHGINLNIANGSYVWFWGLEVTDSHLSRDPSGSTIPGGIYATRDTPTSHDLKFINLVVHDIQNSAFHWFESNYDSELYGIVDYFNGAKTKDHGVYLHNQTGHKWITDSVFGDNAGYGIHGYADGADKYLNGIVLSGNIVYNAGSIGCAENTSTCRQAKPNILLGGLSGNPVNDGVIDSNYTYHWTGSGGSLNLGYSGGSRNSRIVNNYLMIGRFSLGSGSHSGLSITGNTIYYNTLENVSTGSYANNVWTSSKPSGTKIVVRPNRYESGRANIAVYNWGGASSVRIPAANLSGTGLSSGDRYELRNVQNYFGDVLTGVYDGSGITVPMIGRTVGQPLKLSWKPASTFPEFGAFVLLRIAASGPTPTLISSTPTITIQPTAITTPSIVPTPTSLRTPTPLLSQTPMPVRTPTAVISPTPGTVRTVSLRPIADTFVRSDYPENIYGTSLVLGVDSNPVKVAYLLFDTSPISNIPVISVTLRLHSDSKTGAESSVRQTVYSVGNTDWSEVSTTYSNRPAIGSVLAFTDGIQIDSWTDISLPSISGVLPSKLSFAISQTLDDGADFMSRESQFSPELMITINSKMGDANSDMFVDGLDYVIWINHYGTAALAGPSDGDFNLDGRADGIDYVIWLANYGR